MVFFFLSKEILSLLTDVKLIFFLSSLGNDEERIGLFDGLYISRWLLTKTQDNIGFWNLFVLFDIGIYIYI